MQDEDTRNVAHKEQATDPHQKKRRKLSGGDEDRHEEDFTPDAEKSNIPVDSKLPSQGSLPSFPEPAAPNAPSKSVLAMQGIDKALVHAEIINPTTVLPILPSGVDERTRLSERTRKRLLELGITELFAGQGSGCCVWRNHKLISSNAVQTALLPFLISQGSGVSPLYPMYSCPRDACVSAPTGSGKTLAYVLPIIEVSRLLGSSSQTELIAIYVGAVQQDCHPSACSGRAPHPRPGHSSPRNVRGYRERPWSQGIFPCSPP